MSAPAFDITLSPDSLPAFPPKRNFLGWGLLILFFGLFGSMATVTAVTRKVEGADKYMQVAEGLRISLATKNMLRSLDPSSANPAAAKPPNPPKALEEAAFKDPDAAMLVVALRDEQGVGADRRYFDLLARSKKDVYKAFAAIYSEPKLTVAQAEALAARIKGDEFLYRLARAEAFERAGDPAAKEAVAPARVAIVGTVGGLLFGLGVMVGIALWTVYIAQRRQEKLRPLGHPAGWPSLPAADNYALRAAVLMAAFLALGQAVAFMTTKDAQNHASVLGLPGWVVNLTTSLIVIAVSFLIGNTRIDGVRLTLKQLGIRFERFGTKLAWAFGGFLGNLPFLAFTVLITNFLLRYLPTPEHPANELIKTTHNPLAIGATLFLASVQAPIFEEILFRGLLFPALSRVFRSHVAGAVVSSLMFASLHPQGPALWLGLASVGMVNCFLTYQTKSLVPAMLLHAIHNTALLTFALFFY